MCWYVKVDHHVDVRDVQPPTGHIRCHQNGTGLALELIQRSQPLSLEQSHSTQSALVSYITYNTTNMCSCVPYLRQLAMQWNGIETEIPQQKSRPEVESVRKEGGRAGGGAGGRGQEGGGQGAGGRGTGGGAGGRGAGGGAGGRREGGRNMAGGKEGRRGHTYL